MAFILFKLLQSQGFVIHLWGSVGTLPNMYADRIFSTSQHQHFNHLSPIRALRAGYGFFLLVDRTKSALITMTMLRYSLWRLVALFTCFLSMGESLATPYAPEHLHSKGALRDNRRPALYTEDYGKCQANPLIDITRFDGALYRDNMTVTFDLDGVTSETGYVMSTPCNQAIRMTTNMHQSTWRFMHTERRDSSLPLTLARVICPGE